MCVGTEVFEKRCFFITDHIIFLECQTHIFKMGFYLNFFSKSQSESRSHRSFKFHLSSFSGPQINLILSPASKKLSSPTLISLSSRLLGVHSLHAFSKFTLYLVIILVKRVKPFMFLLFLIRTNSDLFQMVPKCQGLPLTYIFSSSS